MIHVTLSWLVLLYLLLMLGPVVGAWMLSEWERRRRESAAFRHLLLCPLCSLEFQDASSATLPRCPRCGCAIERRRISRL